MKITDKTTLAEADVERMRLGISSMYVSLTLLDGRRNVEVLGVTAEGVITAVAQDWATAIGDLFEKRTKQLASYFAPRDRVGHIALVEPGPLPIDWCGPVEVVHGKPGREPYRRPEIIRPRASGPTLGGEDLPSDPVARRELIRDVVMGAGYKCNVPMCGESGVCDECRARGAR